MHDIFLVVSCDDYVDVYDASRNKVYHGTLSFNSARFYQINIKQIDTLFSGKPTVLTAATSSNTCFEYKPWWSRISSNCNINDNVSKYK